MLPLFIAANPFQKYPDCALDAPCFRSVFCPQIATLRVARTAVSDVPAQGGSKNPGLTTEMMNNPELVHAYTVPEFAQRIADHAPKKRLHLAMRPTPIQPFPLHRVDPSFRNDVTVHIKRDDLTGIAESGNKLRKLEFLLAHALATGHDTVITAGGIQSNHARVVSVLARQIGLTPHIFLRCKRSTDPQDLGSDGNVLIHKLVGAHIHLVKYMPFLTGLLPQMQALKKRLSSQGSHAYLIGIGGSDPVGVWGYIEGYAELLEQNLTDEFTHVALAIGSGGTAAGLAIANFLSGSPVRIVAFTVSDDAEYFYNHVNEMLTALGLAEETNARNILTVIEAKGRGYGINSDEDMRFAVSVASHTGILLDPTYTLKAVRGLISEIAKDGESVFHHGARILFIHTGGLFGIFDRRIEPFLNNSLTETWPEQDFDMID